jgi:hypothetical protein
MNKLRSTWLTGIGGVLILLAVNLTASVVWTIPAVAAPGLKLYNAEPSPKLPAGLKQVVAHCPTGKRIFDGGASIDDLGLNRAFFFRLEPIRDVKGDYYIAMAAANGISGNWSISAYAICGNDVPGLGYYPSTSLSSSATFRAWSSRCPAGKRVVGTGATVQDNRGEVGIQMTRASGPLDIARATARDDANGYSGTWRLTSIAMCANADAVVFHPPASAISTQQGASVNCPLGTWVSGAGGGGSLTDSGPFWLRGLLTAPDLRSVRAYMTGVPATGMVAQAICVS